MKLADSLKDIVETKGVPEELVIEAVKESFTQAYQEVFGAKEVEIEIDLSKDIFQILIPKEVVKRVRDPRSQVNIKQAAELLELDIKEIPQDIKEIKAPHNPTEDFSSAEIMRISESILYRLREYEKNSLRYEFIKRRGELVSGSIVKIDQDGNIFVDIQKAIARLPIEEQSPLEHYEQGDSIKAIVYSVQTIEREFNRGRKFEIILSRRSPNLIRELMKVEIPDVGDGSIEIKNIARSVGYKTKVIVDTDQSNIDPLASCIGPHGVRIISVIKEVGGEKIDIIRYSADIKELIRNALSPARVDRVIIADEENKLAYAVVPQDQLPYAFGKQKQNVILVSKLSGYKIQVTTDGEINQNNIQGVEVQGLQDMFGTNISSLGLDADIVDALHAADIFSSEQLMEIYEKDSFEEISSLSTKDVETIKSLLSLKSVHSMVKDEEMGEEILEEEGTSLSLLPGFKDEWIDILKKNAIRSVEDLVEIYQEEGFHKIKELDEETIEKIKDIIIENIEIEE